MRKISYRQAIGLAIEDAAVADYLTEAVDNHKNWGQFMLKMPSWALVGLVERIKAMAEETLGDKIPVEIDDEDL